MDPSDKAIRIAARIADGSAIDWEAAASARATPSDRALIDQLRAISDVATVHRTPGGGSDVSAPPAAWDSLTILSSVGKGRFGEVFVAWDPRLHRRVALKLLYASSSSLASPTRAIDEARLLARVRHQNVLTVYGAECVGDCVGIWTEFIEGRTLEQLVTERGRLDPDEVKTIGADLAHALGAVHGAGLLHRDIKAQNVMRETGGRIVLMDFGAGHDLELSPARDGDYTGTPLYLAPEVVTGGAASHASDIYALGVLLFHLLTGSHPVTGRTLEEVRAAHRDGHVQKLADVRTDVPEGLRRAIDQCLASNPAERFATAHELSAALGPPALAAVAPPRWSRLQLSMVAVLALIAAAAIVWSSREVPPTSRDAAPPVSTSTTPPATLAAAPPQVPPPVADMATLRIWKGPEVHADGTASANGRFLSATGGTLGLDVVIRDLQLQADRVIEKSVFTKEVSRYADATSGNAISRDASRVAYPWCDDCASASPKHAMQLKIGSVGTTPRVLLEDPDIKWFFPHDWSPDNKWIALSFGRRDRSTHIGLVSVASGQLTDLKTVDWRGPARMVFSPDGRYLAYDLSVQSTAQRDVFVIDRARRRTTPTVISPKNDLLAGWSPDGSTLLFTSDRSGALGVWGVLMADGKPADAPRMIKPDLGSRAFTITVTASGTLIYGVQASSQNVKMATVDFTTGKLLSGPVDVAEHYQVRNAAPAWSADGRLAIESERPGNVTALSVLPANLKGPIREIIPEMDLFQRPRWAPDGSITVQGTDLAGRNGFFRVDAASGKTTPIVVCEQFGVCRQSSWTPDGQFLVYRRVTPNEIAVVLRDMVRGEDRVLASTDRKGQIDGVSVSPDGTKITYIVHEPRSYRATLYLLPLAGGEARELSRVDDAPYSFGNVAEWTPDSKRLVVAKINADDAREPPRVWIVPIDGGTEVEIAGFHPKIQANSISIHPDGKRVAFSTGGPRFEIWTLSNFLTPSGPGK
jgi:serine/threonine protein kinase/Tol biopolymer transport system component